jgi:hypothetical protein
MSYSGNRYDPMVSNESINVRRQHTTHLSKSLQHRIVRKPLQTSWQTCTGARSCTCTCTSSQSSACTRSSSTLLVHGSSSSSEQVVSCTSGRSGGGGSGRSGGRGELLRGLSSGRGRSLRRLSLGLSRSLGLNIRETMGGNSRARTTRLEILNPYYQAERVRNSPPEHHPPQLVPNGPEFPIIHKPTNQMISLSSFLPFIRDPTTQNSQSSNIRPPYPGY